MVLCLRSLANLFMPEAPKPADKAAIATAETPSHDCKLLLPYKPLGPSLSQSDAAGFALGLQSHSFDLPPIELPPKMAPAQRPDFLAKEHFGFVFGGVKTQNYHDPAAKGPGSHT